MTDKPKIFVSHIHEESALADVTKNGLEDAFVGRVAVFVSSNAGDNPGGGNWLDKIAGELRDPLTCMLISLVSPLSVREPWISIELGASWILKRAVFPLCHSGQLVGALPRPLGDFIGADLANDAAASLLIGAVEKATGLNVPKKWPRDEFLSEMRVAADSFPGSAANSNKANNVAIGNKQAAREPHIDLEPEEVRILQVLAAACDNGEEEVSAAEMPARCYLKSSLFALHGETLHQLRLVHRSVYTDGMTYRIMPPGIGWLKDHRALPPP